jgi:hypothetical protein
LEAQDEVVPSSTGRQGGEGRSDVEAEAVLGLRAAPADIATSGRLRAYSSPTFFTSLRAEHPVTRISTLGSTLVVYYHVKR